MAAVEIEPKTLGFSGEAPLHYTTDEDIIISKKTQVIINISYMSLLRCGIFADR